MFAKRVSSTAQFSPDKMGKSTEEDARDLKVQRENQEAGEVYLHGTGEERSTAKIHYLKLVGVFNRRVLDRELRVG